MPITVIKGGISSGKTALCMNMIEKLHKTNKCIMLVNDKYSFETEKSFIRRFGGTGLNNIEVMTFRKMADSFISSENTLYMNEAGKHMLIRRAIRQYLSQNPPLSANMLRTMQKDGFNQVAASFLSEMGNYRTTSEQIREVLKDQTDKNFVEKMTVIADLYDIYNKIAEDMSYTDSNEFLDILAKKIEEDDEFFKDAYVFVDAFNDFLLPRWNVIKVINKKAKGVYITLCVSDKEGEKELYEINRETLDMIKDEYVIDEIEAGAHLMHTAGKNAELYHLINTWNSDEVYNGTPSNIKMFRSLDMYMEIERVACKIVDLVREEGYRYRDIAVVASDDEAYASLLESVFGEYKIPYFSDRKQLLYNHPIAVQITSLFDMFENGFDYDSVFSYLKAGFIFRENNGVYENIKNEEIDELENYVIRYGIKGKTRWLKNEDFAREQGFMAAAFEDGKEAAFREYDEKRAKMLNRLREEVINPVRDFELQIKKAKTGKSYVKALLDFFESINLQNGLEAEIVRLEAEGKIDESQQFERIWELILGVLDQIVVTMGNEKMDMEEFSEYIKSGISTCEIRLVPSGIDRVYFGCADESAFVGAKVLFAMGATEGTYPNTISAQGFLSDSERTLLNSHGKTKMFAQTVNERMARKNHSIFELFARISDYIFISTYSYNSSSNPVGESMLISKIEKKFSSVAISNNFSQNNSESKFYISTPRATLHKMLINKSSKRKGQNPIWDAVKEYYKDSEEFKEKLHLLEGESEFFKAQDYIGEDLAQKLYGSSMTYSKSKLDEYAKCPYRFFLNYGLGIKEREEWEISKADLGSYAHEIIEKFCHVVESDANTPEEKLIAWRSLDDEKKSALLAKIFEDVKERIDSSNINQQEKTAHILKRMNKVISNAADFITDCFVHGQYTIKGTELELSVPISDEVTVNGFIDRIDELDSNGKKHLRIIDYKTGSSGFDIVDIYNGVNMQMPIYALAAKTYYQNQNEDCDITGLYYTKLRGELKKDEKEVKALKKLDGVTFADDPISAIREMDDTIGNENKVFSITLNKDGSIRKNLMKNIRTEEEGEKLIEYVKDKILEFDDNIRKKGDIRIMPYRGDCEYCDYQRICSVCDKIKSREPDQLAKGKEWEKICDYRKKGTDL